MLVFMLFYVSFHNQAFAQQIDMSVPEKIYLQLSAKDYATDQNIWFKAIITDSKNHLPSKNSGILYVDFIAPNEQILAHKLIKLSEGIGNGSFQLKNNFEEGRYLIRAYTQWNRNYGTDFIFKTYIRVHHTGKDKNRDTLDLNIIKREDGERLLVGKIKGTESEEKVQKQIQVVADWGYGKDTLRLKQNKGFYPIVYSLPKEADWVNLTVKEEGFRSSKTIVLPHAKPDVQFFPESGKIVHGIKSKVGFKAVGFDGKGMEVQGELQDLDGNKIRAFKSNHLGMGTFIFEPDDSMRYQVMASFPKNGDSIFTFDFPKVVSKGSILTVEKRKDNIRFKVASNELQGAIFIKISCRGRDYFMIEGPLRNGRMITELAALDLPEGILSLTLLDSLKNPIAERLYYNELTSEHLKLTLTTDKATYGRRQKTELDIDISQDDSIALSANLSVLVLNKAQWNRGAHGNIRSYFLLDSELRGEIEDARHYYRPENKNRHTDMDALLLTQGWRNYKYPVTRQSSTFFWPEKSLLVKGTAITASRKKTRDQEVDITLAAFGEKSILYSQQTDSTGRFKFELDDFYGQQIKLLLSAKNTKDDNNNYKISLTLPSPPEVVYEVVPQVQKISQTQRALLTAKERRDKTNAVFDSLYGVTQLDEVVVEGYQLTPQRTQAYQKFGEPNVVIKGDMIRKKEKKWSFGLFSILMFNYGDQIKIEQFPDGFMLAQIAAGNEPTLLAVDGRLIEKSLYSFAPIMSSEIIESVELIKYAKNFKNQYLTVFPNANYFTAPRLGHIISIYTKGNVGMTATGKPPPGTLNYVMQSFSPVKEFYAPKYDTPIPPGEDQPDLRSIIHWQPSLEINANRTDLSFYNGDLIGEYVILVEAISADGRLGYQELRYKVKD